MKKKSVKVSGNRKPVSDRKRKDAVFPGYDDLKKQSLGITEDEELDELNVHHDKESGEFSTSDESGCDSSYFVDKKRKGKLGTAPDINDAGRGRNKDRGTGKFKCSTGQPKFESLWREFLANKEDTPDDESVDVPHDMYDAAKEMQKDKVLIRKLRKALADADKGNKTDCPLSYQDALRIVNTLDKAQKGKLYDDK